MGTGVTSSPSLPDIFRRFIPSKLDNKEGNHLRHIKTFG
jgi:hypothetical protein